MAARASAPALVVLWSLLLAVFVARLPTVDASQSGATAPVLTIPLDKQYVPVLRNGVTVAHKTAYFGKVFLGTPVPQEFTVVFDTGSGHFFLPSRTCRSETCRRHRSYDRDASASAVDINHDGSVVRRDDSERDEVSVVYGTGEISGSFVRDMVCLSNHSGALLTADDMAADCAKVRVVLATGMTEEPFGAFRFDGVVGLGLEALSLDPEFSFFGQMSRMSGFKEARFGYFLSQDDSVPSEISFGGHDARRVATDLRWTPVHRPELGYWQVKIRSVTVDGKILEACEDGSCSAIADTGTSLLGVPKQVLRSLHVQLARKVPGDPEQLDCRGYAGPQLVFDLGHGVRVELGPEDYSRAAAMRIVQNSTNRAQVICRASLMPVDADPGLGGKTWILGEPVLRKYYTAYDWRAQQIGFALAASPGEAHAAAEAPVPAVIHV